MSNDYMRRYWQGYRACKAHVYDCRRDSATSAYTYGLNGKSAAYCRGWKRYLETGKNGE